MVIIIGRKRIDLHHSDDCEEKKTTHEKITLTIRWRAY